MIKLDSIGGPPRSSTERIRRALLQQTAPQAIGSIPPHVQTAAGRAWAILRTPEFVESFTAGCVALVLEALPDPLAALLVPRDKAASPGVPHVQTLLALWQPDSAVRAVASRFFPQPGLVTAVLDQPAQPNELRMVLWLKEGTSAVRFLLEESPAEVGTRAQA